MLTHAAEIAIEDDGTVFISSEGGEAAEKAKQIIDSIANPHVPEAGEQYNGKVVKTTSFGAFVNLTPAPTVCCTSARSATSPTVSASTPSKTCSRKATPSR